jgi:hypothetical protein
MPLTGAFVHARQALSVLVLQVVLYCPTGHVEVLHRVQVAPFKKYPALHDQSHASAPYGLPPEM